MPLFTYRCPICKREWDEKRDREDPNLDVASVRGGCVQAGTGEQTGRRVLFESIPAIYYHGRGWSQVDKNYAPGE
jgi:hypothetical protein